MHDSKHFLEKDEYDSLLQETDVAKIVDILNPSNKFNALQYKIETLQEQVYYFYEQFSKFETVDYIKTLEKIDFDIWNTVQAIEDIMDMYYALPTQCMNNINDYIMAIDSTYNFILVGFANVVKHIENPESIIKVFKSFNNHLDIFNRAIESYNELMSYSLGFINVRKKEELLSTES